VFSVEFSNTVAQWSKRLRPVSDEQGANAAVAILLRVIDGELQVLLVKRVESSADPWSGQIAFPGGKRDPKDSSLQETIIRETWEETNIDLLASCRFLGVLRAVRSRPRPELKILPFVILIDHEQPIRLSEKELAGFFWIPLLDIIKGERDIKLSIGVVRAYVVRTLTIWGLTHGIIEDFTRTVKFV
jgi:8-oxo-dGTP diphosphatase